MSRFDEPVAEEWAENQVSTHRDFSKFIDGKLSEDPIANIAAMTASFFATLLTLKISKEEKSRLANKYILSLQRGLGSLPDVFEGLDAAQTEKLNAIVPHLLNLGFVVGTISAQVLGEPNRREVEAVEASQKAASKARRKAGDPVRDAARSDIAANPKTTQTACARRVAKALDRDQGGVQRLIKELFEWRDLPGGGREKRPIGKRVRQIAG